ncbi:MAG TPA: hypothetical protein VMU92_05075 [Acidobacteriaceae bacterium]|nr:hypothetical protein [Acidobacteriaceae bacterium]
MISQFRRASCAALLLSFALAATVSAQKVNPGKIVRDAAYNELHARDNHPFRYTLRKDDNGKVTTKEIIETTQGDVARLIAINDKPLSPAADAAEMHRLQNLLAHPELQAHRLKKEQADSNRANEMLRLLPTAFIYQYEGMVQGSNGPCYRFKMEPDPNFDPPDRQAEVLHGMAGELWIDQREQRMVRLNVHLISDVEFGWGIFGRLYQGGTILVEQKDVGQGHWEQSLLRLNLRGTILLFKSLVIDTTETESNYAPVPVDWTYQDAVRALLSENH